MKILSKADGIKKVKSMQKTGGARIYKVKKVKTNVRGKNITMYNLFTKNTRHSSMSNPYGLEMMRYGGDKAAYLEKFKTSVRSRVYGAQVLGSDFYVREHSKPLFNNQNIFTLQIFLNLIFFFRKFIIGLNLKQ